VHANGAVIKPAETIMEIVPSDDRLLVEVQVEPQDIDNVALGQDAEVRMLAFKQRTTPTLKGIVSYVSADALKNAQTGATFYLARIEVPEAELKRLGSHVLQPGMPAQAMIQTGKRTALVYMVQPMLDSINRAWRDR
jgi:HlyD family type I secretion membrane fusion protein